MANIQHRLWLRPTLTLTLTLNACAHEPLPRLHVHTWSTQRRQRCAYAKQAEERERESSSSSRRSLVVEHAVLLLASLVVILTLRASRCLGRGSRQLPGISSQAPPPHPRPDTPHILPIVALSSHEPHLPVSSCIGSVVSHGICFTAFACIPIGPLLRTRRNEVMVMIPTTRVSMNSNTHPPSHVSIT